MPAYMIAQIHVHDPRAYQPYLDGFMPCFQRHGGELLATSQEAPRFWKAPGTIPAP